MSGPTLSTRDDPLSQFWPPGSGPAAYNHSVPLIAWRDNLRFQSTVEAFAAISEPPTAKQVTLILIDSLFLARSGCATSFS